MSRLSLAPYLERIGHTGPLRADLETLTAIHRAHLRSIPYENLDIHLDRTLSLDLEAQFTKLVIDRRGGRPATTTRCTELQTSPSPAL